MLLLEWILAIVTFPFWFPVLLLIIGFLILMFGSLLLVFLLLDLSLIIWILKSLYNVHVGLLMARQTIVKKLKNNMSWKKFLLLILNGCTKWVKDEKKN